MLSVISSKAIHRDVLDLIGEVRIKKTIFFLCLLFNSIFYSNCFVFCEVFVIFNVISTRDIENFAGQPRNSEHKKNNI